MPPKRVVEEILEKVNIMPLEDQCIITEILKNRYREKRRGEILKYLEETMEEYRKGLTSKGSVADLLKELESD